MDQARLRVLTFALLLPACTRLNPDFDPGASEVGTGMSSGTSSTSEVIPTSGATGGATGGATSGLTLSGSAASGTTEPLPTDCWGRPSHAWDTLVELPDAQLGAAPRSPRIAPAGDMLYYIAGVPPRPYSAPSPFVLGTELAAWPGLSLAMDYPNLLGAGTEMILAGRLMGLDDNIVVSTNDGGGWTEPSPLPWINTDKDDSLPTLMADGSRMIFQRNDGPVNEALMVTTWNFYEATRVADAPPGTDFSAPTLVVLPGYSDDPTYAHVNLCATLSPDGLHLFFGSTYPKHLDGMNVGDALQIHYTQRSQVESPWRAPELALQHPQAGWETCPSSVTADGCTLFFHHFMYPADPGDYQIWVATRSPA